jgi:hypothetical protein
MRESLCCVYGTADKGKANDPVSEQHDLIGLSLGMRIAKTKKLFSCMSVLLIPPWMVLPAKLGTRHPWLGKEESVCVCFMNSMVVINRWAEDIIAIAIAIAIAITKCLNFLLCCCCCYGYAGIDRWNASKSHEATCWFYLCSRSSSCRNIYGWMVDFGIRRKCIFSFRFRGWFLCFHKAFLSLQGGRCGPSRGSSSSVSVWEWCKDA